jgi:hypothetical protein
MSYGHGFYLEDGYETNNIFDANIGITVPSASCYTCANYLFLTSQLSSGQAGNAKRILEPKQRAIYHRERSIHALHLLDHQRLQHVHEQCCRWCVVVVVVVVVIAQRTGAHVLLLWELSGATACGRCYWFVGRHGNGPSAEVADSPIKIAPSAFTN